MTATRNGAKFAHRAMGKLELVSRRRDEKDKRNVLVQRTVKGALYLERLSDTIGELARRVPT